MWQRRDPFAEDLDALLERVYAYVSYRVGDSPEAEDITGEVFERALRYRHAYDPSRGEPVAWLIGIARTRLAEPRWAPEPAVDRATAPLEERFEDESLARVTLWDAFRGLNQRDRELVALRYGADLTSAQIGNLLGMAPNAVDVALHRALARLRAELESSDEPEAPLGRSR